MTAFQVRILDDPVRLRNTQPFELPRRHGETTYDVIPAQAGIQNLTQPTMDTSFHWNDGEY